MQHKDIQNGKYYYKNQKEAAIKMRQLRDLMNIEKARNDYDKLHGGPSTFGPKAKSKAAKAAAPPKVIKKQNNGNKAQVMMSRKAAAPPGAWVQIKKK